MKANRKFPWKWPQKEKDSTESVNFQRMSNSKRLKPRAKRERDVVAWPPAGNYWGKGKDRNAHWAGTRVHEIHWEIWIDKASSNNQKHMN